MSRSRNGYIPFGEGMQAEFNRALALHKIGDLQGARKIYQQIYKVNKKNADLNHLLGLVEHRLGCHEKGLKLIERAVKENPGQPLYLRNLGSVYQEAGRLLEALNAFKRAIALKPDYVEAVNGLGAVYLAIGQADMAINTFQSAIKLDPEFMDAKFNLANALVVRGDYEKAAFLYQYVLERNPNDIEAMSRLASVLRDAGHREQSAAVLRKALGISPDSVVINQQLAELYEANSKLPEAFACVEKVLGLQPRHAGANRLKAVLLRREGHINDAIQLLANQPIPQEDTVEAELTHFELGRLYDRAGNAERAFFHFSEGNRLQAQCPVSKRFEKRRYLNQVIKAGENCTQEWYKSWIGRAADLQACDTPIFLVAFPRSGTTLLDQILDSHPALQVLEEQPLLTPVINRIEELKGMYPEGLAELSAIDIEELRGIYFAELEKSLERKPGTTIVDKMPLNIVEIRLIHRLFPDARIIVALRHPYDVCLSNFMQHFDLNDAMSNFLTLEDAARLYHEVFTLWEKYVAVLPLNVHMVKYEDLVMGFETQVRAVLEFLGLPWDESVMNYFGHARERKQIDTPSYQQVTEPIYQRACFRWKRYEKQLDSVRNILCQHAERMGYKEV